MNAPRAILPIVLVLASCALATPGTCAQKPPPESRYYEPCLDRGPVRLHGRGFKVEAVSSEWREEGAYYVLAAGPGEAQGREGIIRWEDLRGVDVWNPSPSKWTNVGFVGGAALGAGVMLLATDSPGGFGDFFYILGVGAVAFASGYVGSLIGARHGGPGKGHWVPCRSVWYPYGQHASLALATSGESSPPVVEGGRP